MPVCNTLTASTSGLSGNYFSEADQDYSPTDDMFSEWNTSDSCPETFSYIPCNPIHFTDSYSSINAGNSIQQSPDEWSDNRNSPFTPSSGFYFCETFQDTREHRSTQDDNSLPTRHTNLCDIKIQATTSLPDCIVAPTKSAAPRTPKQKPTRRNGMAIDTTPSLPRKRGRPRINRSHASMSTSTSSSSFDTNTPRRPTCLPHKQVERKYREGLNQEMERLRRAVPTLLQSTESSVMGVAKPSKGMVLAAAVTYILRIEKERDEALDEVERLGEQ